MSAQTNENPLIVIAGNMAVGKTTFAELLHTYYNIPILPENFNDNPYLEKFYEDMATWAYPSQLFFLEERAKQSVVINSRQTPLILDRSVYEDRGIFAENLYRKNFISPEDFGKYEKRYQEIITALPSPSLLVFLTASVDTLMKRMANRGRDFEQNIDRSYLEALNTLYNEWVDSLPLVLPKSRILKIETDTLNLVSNHTDIESGLRQIEKNIKLNRST
ncbi:MAG: deoxynucleoside kinase [Patescibacteria group bacterium]